MGLRETLNENPAIATAVAIGLIIVLLVFVLFQTDTIGSSGPTVNGDTWFTTDDGKTRTPGEALDVYNLDANGQPMVRAHVFKIDGEERVVYLSRYTTDSMKQVKRPGAGDWVDANSPDGRAIIAESTQATASGERPVEVRP